MTNPQGILVWGANSAIAREVQKLYAAQNCRFFLVGRNSEKLAAVADDLSVRGGEICGSASLDFNRHDDIESILGEASERLGSIDITLIAHGSLPNTLEVENSAAAVKACMDVNFTSAAVIIQSCAHYFSLHGRGKLAVISSVAGDRGRKSNYVYGAAKSGIDTLLQGLRGRFSGTDIKIVTIKPGMVKTPMTAGMKQGALWTTPEAIAPVIIRAIGKGQAVCYVPGYWRLIMWVIRSLPTTLLAKLPI